VTTEITTAKPKPTGKRKDGKPSRERGKGSIGKVQGSRYFYIWYYGLDGNRRREPTKTTDSRKAEKILRHRLVAIDKGESVDFRTMRYEDLRALL
jgi:hypothetical protein